MAKHRKKKQPARATLPRPAGSGAPTAVPPEAELRRGLAAFQRGDYDEAIQAWKQARRAALGGAADLALAEAHFRRAITATSAARRAQELHEATALAPDRAIYHFHLGLAYHRQGQLRRACAAYETAHRLAPDDDRFRRHLALTSLADPAAAPRVHDLLAGASPRDEAAARLRALAALRQNEPAAAVRVLAAPGRPSPLTTLALGLAQLADGQTTAAVETLARVRRSRRPLAAEARQAAAIATVVAQTRTGDLSTALGLLRTLDVPDDPALRRALAAAGRALGRELVLDERAEEALLAWQRAVAAEPGHEPGRRALDHLHEVLGTRAVRRGDFAAAARHWEATLAEQPDNTRILRNLALVEERLERWPQAAARWEALTQRWKKDLRGARRDDEASATLRRRLAVAYRHLAATYEATGDLPAATRTFERALNFDPADVDLRLRAAELYLENEQYGSAIEHLHRVVATRPEDTRVLIDLGSAYDLKGDDRQAQSYLERALSLEPENQAIRAVLAGVHHGRGHRLLDAGQVERAAAELARARELDPGVAEHSECLGEAYLKLGRLDAAQAAFARSLALNPQDPKSRVTIGGIYLEAGHEREAETLFRQALRLNRGLVTHLAIGLTYFRAGRPAAAEQHFQRVLKGREPLLQALLGKVFIEARREEEAIPYLERALSLDPINVRARLDLAWAYTFGRGDYARAAAEIAAAERLARALGDRASLAEIANAREAVAALSDAARSPKRSGPVGAAWR